MRDTLHSVGLGARLGLLAMLLARSLAARSRWPMLQRASSKAAPNKRHRTVTGRQDRTVSRSRHSAHTRQLRSYLNKTSLTHPNPCPADKKFSARPELNPPSDRDGDHRPKNGKFFASRGADRGSPGESQCPQARRGLLLAAGRCGAADRTEPMLRAGYSGATMAQLEKRGSGLHLKRSLRL